MAKKLSFRRKGGVHRHRHLNGRQKTYRKGDIIKVEHPDELGNALDMWEPVKGRSIKRRSEKKSALDAKKTAKKSDKIKLPKRAADGIKTENFVRDVDVVVNKKSRNTWIDPETAKVYWMDEHGYLSPMNPENPDDPPRDGSGDIIGSIASDEPKFTLKAVHIGGGWYDVVNEKTKKVLNDVRLRQKDAEALIDGKIVESTKDMA